MEWANFEIITMDYLHTSLLGNLRFMPPVTVSPWREVLRADTFGPVCPQNLPEVIFVMMIDVVVVEMMISIDMIDPEKLGKVELHFELWRRKLSAMA